MKVSCLNLNSYIFRTNFIKKLNLSPEIDHTTLCMVLGEPVINADELSLFEAMVRWGIKECERRGIDINSPERQRQCLGEALFLIRYVKKWTQFYTNTITPALP